MILQPFRELYKSRLLLFSIAKVMSAVDRANNKNASIYEAGSRPRLLGPHTSTRLRRVFINGRFLSQKLTGVQRYALQITTALDDVIGRRPDLRALDWRLCVPADANNLPALRHIAIEELSGIGSHRWEQITLACVTRGGVLLCLGNSAPLLHWRTLVVIHDVAVFRTPDNFSRKYATAHRLLTRMLARTAQIGTVSHFSRGELASVLGKAESDIFVAGNGAEHMGDIVPDAEIVRRLSLTPGRYFVFVGTPARNKNLQVVLTALARLPAKDVSLVLVGSFAGKVFAGGDMAGGDNVVMAGHLSDAEVAGLLKQAAALVFPSRYEGFGIPPLEAMMQRCPVIASDIPPSREICGDAALYFDADDALALAELMQRELDTPRDAASRNYALARARLFTWRDSADKLAVLLTRALATG
jgi:glycosyltransferase involved in cell wall biosynthesis